jgi:hypothetical protein
MKTRTLFTLLTLLIAGSAFAQSPDLSLIPYRKGNLWGYAAPDKQVVISPRFQDAQLFYEGFAVVKLNSKFGYINKKGKLVIPCRYFAAKHFRYGYFGNTGTHTEGSREVKNKDTVLFAGASPKDNGYEQCINTLGEVMSRCPAINENSVQSNSLDVSNRKTYSLVNNANLYDSLVDDYKIMGDDHWFYIGMKNGKYGVINNFFEVVLPFDYSSIDKIDISGKAYLHAAKDNMHGILNGTGSVFIPVDNSELAYIRAKNNKDYILLLKDKLASVRDFDNNLVIAAKYRAIMYDGEGGFVLISKDNTRGYYFLNGFLIEPKYTDVKQINKGSLLQVTTVSGKTGFVGPDGHEFFDE